MADEQHDNPVVLADAPMTAVNQLPTLQQEMSLDQVAERVEKVRKLHTRLMKENIHYGVIPGTQKPTLLKPGAELILMTFMLDPQYTYDVKQNGDHREIFTVCTLYHIPSGRRVASGVGCCSTMESKYRWRYEMKCPSCEKPALMRSKYGAQGWYCNPKRDGCGSSFPKDDKRIKAGKQENPDLADQYNTVLKMSAKRSLIDAALKATAASEAYTQDVEDFPDSGDENPLEQPQEQKPRAAKVEVVPDKPKPVTKPKAAAKPEPAQAEPETVEREPGDEQEPLSAGHMNMLLWAFRNAGFTTKEGEALKAITWLGEYLQIEVVFDLAKSQTAQLKDMLAKLDKSQVAPIVEALKGYEKADA